MSSATGLDEDHLGKVVLDVLANDTGPKKASLWSLDDGISPLQHDGQGHVTPADLMHEDTARSENASSDRSLNGARIWITSEGKAGYDASTLTDAFKAQLQHLQVGQYLTDSFTYATRVGDGQISWTTATVQFAGVNDAPVAVDDGTVTTAINTPISAINVLANDTDVDGDTLSVTGASALHGTVVVNGNGTLGYTPTAGYYGSDSITYAISDGHGGTASAHVAVIVTGTGGSGGAGRIVNDNATTAEDTPVSIHVLANDSFLSTPAITAIGLASHGAVSINNAGTPGDTTDDYIVYTPNADFNGSDSFTYTVTAGGAIQTASVFVTVTEVNDKPLATNDALSSVAEDSGTRVIQFSDLTANDSSGPPNESGQTLTITNVTNAVGGTVAIVNGHIEFTPTADFNGTASFDYTVTDNGTTNGAPDPQSAVAMASFIVTEVNDKPVATNDVLSGVAEDSGTRVIQFSDLTANDSAGPSNENGQSLTIMTVGNAVGGTVAIVNGQIAFTPTADFNGTASFDYTVTDNGTTNGVADPQSAVATASFIVTEVNDKPLATNDALSSVAEDSGTRVIQFSELTANDSAGPSNEIGQTLTITNVTNAAGGTVAFVNGQIAFTPTADFNGTASFDYTVADNGTTNGTPDPQSAVGTASFTVTEVNDAPVAVDDALSSIVQGSDTRVIQFSDLIANDSAGPLNEAGQTLTITSVDNPVGGQVSIFDGHIEFDAAVNFTGTASFEYTISDNGTTNGLPDPKTDVGSVSFTVTPDVAPVVDLNGPAAGQDATASFTEQTPVYIAPAATVADIDSNPIWLLAWLSSRADGNAVESLSLDPTAAAAALAAHLTVSYTPSNGQFWVTGSASPATYQTILDGLQYNDTSDNPSAASRKVVVQVNDGILSSNAHSDTITVTPVNDSPVVDLNGAAAGSDAAVSFAQPAPLTLAPSTTVTDPDSANIASLHATLVARPDGDAFESLSLDASAAAAATTAGLTVSYTASTGLLSVTGSASQATYQTILDGVLYNDTAATPLPSDREVDVVLNDGLADSAPHHVTISGFVF